MTDRFIHRALLSVSDKSGLLALAETLTGLGIEIISTGGTATALRQAGLSVTDVSQVTGFPEILDGRVKTLHPKIHGGLLGLRDKPEHIEAMRAHGIAGIDLLVCNLYPFEAAVAKAAPFAEILEAIDIGGPAMIRAAAKTHEFVAVLVDPEDYAPVMQELERTGGALSGSTRLNLAKTAFSRTAAYDAAVASWLAAQGQSDAERPPPRWRSFAGHLRQELRYGENPHQTAALYRTSERRPGIATARQLQGKELSYNNVNDTDAAYELVAEFSPSTPACAIIKHANPCGVALGTSLADAYRKALACDPVSAFGGILAFNAALDGEAAEEIAKLFTEVIIAPDADEDARRILAAKKNLRVLIAESLPDPEAPATEVRSVAGGLLVQARDAKTLMQGNLKTVTKRKPTPEEFSDLAFAFTVAKHVKSNAVVYAKNGATTGIGAGQMSRVDAARMAAAKARDVASAAGWPEPRTKGSAAASEAFFPFPDGLLAVAEAGATAVIQPGGSVNDEAVIKAADEVGLAMVFTGIRHFRH